MHPGPPGGFAPRQCARQWTSFPALETTLDRAWQNKWFTRDEYSELSATYEAAWQRLIELSAEAFQFKTFKRAAVTFEFDPFLVHGDHQLGKAGAYPAVAMHRCREEYTKGISLAHSLVGVRIKDVPRLQIHVVRNDHPSLLNNENQPQACFYRDGVAHIAYVPSATTNAMTAGWAYLRHLWSQRSKWKRAVAFLFEEETEGRRLFHGNGRESQAYIDGKRFWNRRMGTIPNLELFPGIQTPSLPDAGFECFGVAALTLWASQTSPQSMVNFFRGRTRRSLYFDLISL